MPQQINTHNITERAYAPEIAELLQRFGAHGHDSTGAPHEVLGPELLAHYGDDLLILTPEGNDDFRFLHFGANVARNALIPMTGKLLSFWAPSVVQFTTTCFELALASGKPVHSIHRSVNTVQVRLWERLTLPTIARNGQRYLVVFSRPLRASEELLLTVLQTSPAGIVALRALRDEAGNIERTVIITANRRAAAITGNADNALVDADARSVLPFLADPAVWKRFLYVVELRRDDMLETNFTVGGREIWLQIALAPLADGLVMTLTDVSELMAANLTLQSRAATLALEIGRERATRRALSQEIGQREEREQELRRLAETDPLTALLNRRSLIEKADAEIFACDAQGHEMSLFIIDIDHFKRVNDTYGHAAGDAVIRAFADLLLGQMRETDLVGRLGGEEFAVVLPRTGAATARYMAERLQLALRSASLPVSEMLDLKVTASIGVATRLHGEPFSNFVARADRELYRAKDEGRDCIRGTEAVISVAA